MNHFSIAGSRSRCSRPLDAFHLFLYTCDHLRQFCFRLYLTFYRIKHFRQCLIMFLSSSSCRTKLSVLLKKVNSPYSLFMFTHTVWRLARQPPSEITKWTTNCGCWTSYCFVCWRAEWERWFSTCCHMSATATPTLRLSGRWTNRLKDRGNVRVMQ